MIDSIVRRVAIRVILMAVMLGGASEIGEAQGAMRSFSDPTPGVGDVVRITVWRRPEFSGEFVVSADSTIAHPLYRSVKVAGLSLASVTEKLRTFLVTYEQNPELIVEVLFRVAVVGQVRAPSLYSLTPETTVAQAIALAGGSTDIGKLSSVELVRLGRRIELDLTEENSPAADMGIMSGDRLTVGRRSTFSPFRDLFGPLASLTAAVASVILVIQR